MTVLQPRYLHERSQLELTLKLIAVEARTHTIKRCTGLSDDRIRKIYSRYFKSTTAATVRRRRGKSPRQVAYFVKNPDHQMQATTLYYLFVSSGLLSSDAAGTIIQNWQTPDIEYGHRALAAYDTYRRLYAAPLYNFEWAWALLQILGDALVLTDCNDCQLRYVHDRLGIDFHRCPGCELRLNVQRRPGVNRFV
ncbi:MAG: hypothetical protein AAGC71_03360 [Pseudomonadota bacterium]